MPRTSAGVANLISENLHPLMGADSDYDQLIKQIGEARFVLIGEASHGTHEFYREPAETFLRGFKGRMNMATNEIPRDEWTTFLDTFSRQHEGWLATLEILGTEIGGAQQEARDLPLEGITSTSKDSSPETIAISLGKAAEDHVTHTISEPTRVWLEQTSDGANAALEIESADKVKTLLRFRSALPADMVDGIVLDKSN